MKSSAKTSAPRTTSPEPMELGTARRRTLTKEEYQDLRAKNACFYCRNPNARHSMRLPNEEKTSGKRGQSLTLTVGVSESMIEDGGEDAVQPKPESLGQRLQEVVAVDGATVDTGMQVTEDSVLVPQGMKLILQVKLRL